MADLPVTGERGIQRSCRSEPGYSTVTVTGGVAAANNHDFAVGLDLHTEAAVLSVEVGADPAISTTEGGVQRSCCGEPGNENVALGVTPVTCPNRNNLSVRLDVDVLEHVILIETELIFAVTGERGVPGAIGVDAPDDRVVVSVAVLQITGDNDFPVSIQCSCSTPFMFR